MKPNDPLLCLALARAGFLRPRERLAVARALSSAGAFAALSRGDLELIISRPLSNREVRPAELVERARRDLVSLTGNRIGCIFLGDPRYPRSLQETYDPPLVLFYRGRWTALGTRPAVAVVGTRSPSPEAREAAREVGAALARAGVTVVSGLARGIDGEAHRGAVAEGGSHVAVLGCGLERILPASNAELGRRLLAAGGTLLSEQPPDEPPRKHHFPARNRIISGLARLVLVVQAPARSGALITADFALAENRELLVHAAGLGGELGEGGAALAESGARIVESGKELLGLLGIEPREAPREQEPAEVGKQIARALERELGLG